MQTLKAVRMAAVVLAVGWAGMASAQNITGQVVGRVTDSVTGQPIAGAKVTASSRGWIDQWVTTDARGNYVLTVLPPAHYTIAVQASGYAQASSREIQVMIDWRSRNDMKLDPSSAQTTEAAASGRVAAR